MTASGGGSGPGEETVEAVVRHRLAEALGGRRGMVEGALPIAAFTVGWWSTHNVRVAVGAGVGLAVVLLVLRLAQRQRTQFVLNSLVGIGIAAVFALRSGQPEDAFLPGIIWNAVTAALMVASVLVRWPAVGLLIAGVTGDPTGWRADPQVLRLCSRLTWVLVTPNVVRVIVQYPLWLAGEVGWLAAAKIALGWPLQVAALAAMAYLLGRDRTPLRVSPASP